jgi:glycerophosphoryl diester phosphodiesterase
MMIQRSEDFCIARAIFFAFISRVWSVTIFLTGSKLAAGWDVDKKWSGVFMRKNVVFLLMGVAMMTGCATTFHAGAPKGAVNVIAHRGASAYAPENTLASYKLAKEMNADWFELDCTFTKDGEVIVIHDGKVDRVTNGKGAVSNLTLAELKSLDAGSWKDPKYAGEKLPTLIETLDYAKSAKIGVYIEIKNSADDAILLKNILRKFENVSGALNGKERREMMEMIRESKTRNLDLTEKVAELVKERHMEHQVVIQSFSPVICAVMLAEEPKLRTEILASKEDKEPERWPAYLRFTELLNPKGFNTNGKSFDKSLLEKNHADGRTVAIWTVDEEVEMRSLAAVGVDRLITNKPDVCLKVLTDMGKR